MNTEEAKQFLAERRELEEAEQAYASLMEQVSAASPAERRKLASELSRAELRLERVRATHAELNMSQLTRPLLPLLEAAAEDARKELAAFLADLLPVGKHQDEQDFLTKQFLKEPRQGRALEHVLGRWRFNARQWHTPANAEPIAEAVALMEGLIKGECLYDLLGVPLPKLAAEGSKEVKS